MRRKVYATENLEIEMPRTTSPGAITRAVVGCLLGFAALPFATGCRYVATQTIAEVRGAKAEIHAASPVSSTAFERFRDVEFQPAHSDIGDRVVPAALLYAYNDGAIEAIGKLRDRFPGGEPVVHIIANMLYFQKKSLMSGAEALARVQFTSGGSLVLDSVIRAESESFRAGDEAALARAIVDAIVRLLRGTPEAENAE